MNESREGMCVKNGGGRENVNENIKTGKWEEEGMRAKSMPYPQVLSNRLSNEEMMET